MTDHHHFVDPKSLERWLEDHDGLWVSVLFTLIFVIFTLVMYQTLMHNDVFLLKSSTPFISADW
jgi:hypothetical protein